MRSINAILHFTFLLLLQIITTSSAPANKFSFGRIIGQTLRGVKCAGHACLYEAPIRTSHKISDTASKAFQGSSGIKAKISKGINNMKQELNKPLPRKQKLDDDIVNRASMKLEAKKQKLSKASQKLEEKRKKTSSFQSSIGSGSQSTTSQHVSQPSPHPDHSSPHPDHFPPHQDHSSQHSTNSDANSHVPQRSFSSGHRVQRSHSASL